PNTPEWDLTVGNHVANDVLRPQSRASEPTATRDSTIVKRALITVAALTVCGMIQAQTNDNLVRVQNRLKAEGFFFGDPTGVLDAQTRTALALYQIDHHLTVTGQLDAPTARALDVSTPTPSPTPTNDNLVRVQNRLKAEGYFHGDPTGVLDEQTRIALDLYQVDHDLTVTGKLDAPTARALDASPPTPTPTPTPRPSPTPTATPTA